MPSNQIDKELVVRDPEILSGLPVFAGTRVPIRNLFDCLQDGLSLEEFLADFPGVRREQAVQLLELVKQPYLERASGAGPRKEPVRAHSA